MPLHPAHRKSASNKPAHNKSSKSKSGSETSDAESPGLVRGKKHTPAVVKKEGPKKTALKKEGTKRKPVTEKVIQGKAKKQRPVKKSAGGNTSSSRSGRILGKSEAALSTEQTAGERNSGRTKGRAKSKAYARNAGKTGERTDSKRTDSRRTDSRPNGRPAAGRRTTAESGKTAGEERTDFPKRRPSNRPGAGGKFERPSNDRNRPGKGRRRSGPVKPAFEREDERLQKFLASAGVASRRGCETLIKEGRIEIDGKIVTELGTRVNPKIQEVKFDGESLTNSKRKAYFAVHKPTGVVCTANDPAGRPRVLDLIPEREGRLFNVGRLDMSSEGLILLTNDGELANRLTHPRHGVEKVYHVTVEGKPDQEVMMKLRKGLYLAEGFAHVKNVKIKGYSKKSTILEMILDEGRNREIRRLLAKVGHKVQRLVRIAVGPIRLGEMPAGAYRPLTQEEIKKLRNEVTM